MFGIGRKEKGDGFESIYKVLDFGNFIVVSNNG